MTTPGQPEMSETGVPAGGISAGAGAGGIGGSGAGGMGADADEDLSHLRHDNDIAIIDATERARQLRAKLLEMRTREPDAFPMTDVGDGERFIARWGDKVCVDLSGKANEAMFYTAVAGTLWAPDRTDEVGRMVDVVRNRMYERANQLDPLHASGNEMTPEESLGSQLRKRADRLTTLQGRRAPALIGCSTHGLCVVADEYFDQRGDVLATKTQLLILEPDAVKSHGVRSRRLTSADRITRSTSVEWKPEALDDPSEKILDYLNAFGWNDRVGLEKHLFKLLGYGLLGGNPQRILLIIQGETTTGKSMLADAIGTALGAYAKQGSQSILRGNLDDKPRPDVLDAASRRLVFLPEASDAWELHGDKVKALTGERHILARSLFSNDMREHRIQMLPVIVTNHMPRVIGVDAPLKRRLVRVELRGTLDNAEDASFKDRFVADQRVGEWLLARLMRGYEEYQREGLEPTLQFFAPDTAGAMEHLTHVGRFLQAAQNGGILRRVEVTGAYGEKSTWTTLRNTYEWYRRWHKTSSSSSEKNSWQSDMEFYNTLRTSHGFESVRSGVHRWIGWTAPECKSTALWAAWPDLSDDDEG